MSEFDPKLNVELFKKGVNVNKAKSERYLNVIAYQYNGGEKKLRIQPANKNTNENCDANKKWINVHSISSITKEEAKGLIKLLEMAIMKI